MDLRTTTRARRLELGWSQQELGERAGVSRLWVNEWEGGKSSVRLDAVERVVEALGLSIIGAVRPVDVPPAAKTTGPTGVPEPFWRWFWNAQPDRLSVETDGAYIARRLLGSPDPAAWAWVLGAIEEADLDEAVRGRGADDRTRAMVANWRAQAAVTHVA